MAKNPKKRKTKNKRLPGKIPAKNISKMETTWSDFAERINKKYPHSIGSGHSRPEKAQHNFLMARHHTAKFFVARGVEKAFEESALRQKVRKALFCLLLDDIKELKGKRDKKRDYDAGITLSKKIGKAEFTVLEKVLNEFYAAILIKRDYKKNETDHTLLWGAQKAIITTKKIVNVLP